MKRHVKNYYKAHGLNTRDKPACEVCGKLADDIHHIKPKGMGGSKLKDNPENLIALCRDCHDMAHANELSKEYLRRCKR